jgi:hypothetical protein
MVSPRGTLFESCLLHSVSEMLRDPPRHKAKRASQEARICSSSD